jgi:maltokinase
VHNPLPGLPHPRGKGDMSDTSRSRSVTAQSVSQTAAKAASQAACHPAQLPTPRTHPSDSDLTALVQDALPLLREWLPGQRWFAGKGRLIEGIRPAAITPLPGASPADEVLLLHLLLEVEQRGHDGVDGGTGTDLYQLLLGARAQEPGEPANIVRAAVVGRISGGPHDGTLIYDAAHDGVLTRRLLRLLTAVEAPGTQVGPLRFDNLGGRGGLDGLDRLGREPSRVGTAEQSNTSIVFDDAAILKLFRRVGPGLNPDLELSLALSRAGSVRVPATLAWFEGELPGEPGQPATLGLLQRYLHGARDGWEFALSHVRRLRAEPARRPGPAEQLTGNFSAESFLLGRSTAEVHLALARALPVTVLGRPEIEALADTMAMRLDAAALVVPALVPYRAALHRVFRALAGSARDGGLLHAQRIHGDLHLGQSMRTGRGWVLLDFEGEPAKSLAERRRPQPAVRDVAAMLRSFDYAAAHLLTEVPADDPQRPQLARLAAVWARRNRDAFCAGYAAAGADDPTADLVLLHALETDKAVYEVVYEARNRPDWLPIPMTAIARLAQST